MGKVYLAHDRQHDRQVAIKVLDPHYNEAVGTQRFIREIRIAATLSHSSIVPLYDSGEFEGRLFYVMPYIDGETLRQRLERETMLPVAQALEWAAEVAEGLAAAHARGIIHRDIKPENLLIQGGHLLIADFGLARPVDRSADEGLTSQHLVVGTPRYMSPEQASGAVNLDGRSDLYSLACVLYEMLVGEPPYTGHTQQAITARKLAGEYHRLRVVRPTVPATVDRALAKALSPIPADRFDTVEEFARTLRATHRPVRPLLLAGAAALVIVGVVVGLGVRHFRSVPAAAPHPPRLVVGMFENRTGDPKHDQLGFMAADWLTEGLQQTGVVEVVPSTTALAAARFVAARPGGPDPMRALARETGADLVVSGSIYRDEDSLVFQAQLANAAAGRLIGAVEPLRAGVAHPSEALQQLRARLMGLLALRLDTRAIQAEQPPTYDAYQAFSEGMQSYVRGEYDSAIPAFERAYARDSTFVLALLYASFSYMNRRDYSLADSVLRIVARDRERLSDYNRSWLDYQTADLSGDVPGALAAIRRAAEIAPTSKAPYNFASAAFEARMPFAAESTLRRLSPDVGAMRGWLPYWEILTNSLHAQGKYRQEMNSAREARRRFPDRPDPIRFEARALAARKDTRSLERLWLDVGQTETIATGTLAYEIGEELSTHADSSTAAPWYERAYRAFTRAPPGRTALEARWGQARSAAHLARLSEAVELCQALAAQDKNGRDQYLGLLGVLSVRMGDRRRASELLEQLAGDDRPFTFGEPQLQAGRIAAELGDPERAQVLLASALRKGYPYDMELHRDPSLARLRSFPIMRQLAGGR